MSIRSRLLLNLCAGVILFTLLSSCSINIPTQEQELSDSIPVPTVTPGVQGQTGDKTGEPTITPIAAEEAVYAFLTAYEDNPDAMIPFLSEEMRENLPEGGVLELLDFGGMVEGLVFISGNRLDPHTAVVEAMLQVDGEQLQRIFYLELQGEQWVITGIEKR